MAVASYRKHLTIVTTTDRYDYVQARTEKIIGYSLSNYLGDILEWWFKQGAPPVNDFDKATPVPKFSQIEKYASLRKPRKRTTKKNHELRA